ncbi:sensor histidine kinase [Paenibacillus sp. CF384]|uniref:sensor histidine kinase n=1 Tax=Paenibacillus sp. CF384 TaxID=1884382 RepID=UPI000896DC2D|nr:histidine kinase [Paenibacillus sp. CF384]SDW04956.1 two-component system, sensor histidine kinase YesM [Paenibacillus sp. CF384]
MNSSRKLQWRMTIFPKLIIAFLLVVAPIYGIGLGMNQLGETSVREELSKSLKSKVDFYLNSLEVENERMTGLLRQYAIDKDIQHATFISNTMSIGVWTDTVQRIQEKLQLIKNSSLYIKNVSAHILTLKRTISSDETISDTINPDYEAVATVSKLRGVGNYFWKDRLFMAIAYPGSDLPKMKETFALSIEINQDVMKQSLQNFSDYKNAGAMLVNPENGWILGNQTDEELMKELSDYLKNRPEGSVDEDYKQISAGNSSYFVAYKRSTTFGYYLIAYVPSAEMLGPIDKYRMLLWLLSFVSLVFIVGYSYWLYQLIRKPLHRMITGFRKVEAGMMEPIPLPKTRDEFLYLFQRFNMMTDNLKVLIHEVYEQKLRAQTSELKQLQSQINPHFLYNTYFILYRLAKMNDNDSVIQFSQHLGEYFQYITRNGSDDVPLDAEIKHSRTYVEIQNIRFAKSRIAVEFGELPAGCGEMRVPRLILQPFIENAYQYGLETKRRDGRIAVTMIEQDGKLLMSVEDNGEKLTNADLQSIEANLVNQGADMEYTGMLNVHRRLIIRFGSEYGVSVARGEMGGMKATLRLPMPQSLGKAAEPSDTNDAKGE